jgi:LacI family transcriptional regulator, repressor for deo operon, udp, cdd, tsx, nupC, and nupG
MRIRLQDVAVLADVSEATVSRVLNGRDGVGAITKARVLGVLADMGYLPTSLRVDAKVGLIGLIVPELSNPIFPAYAQAFAARLLDVGFVAVLCCVGRAGATEQDYAQILAAHRIDGMIVVSGLNANTAINHDHYRTLSEAAMPVVFVNGFVEGIEYPSVSCDDEYAASAAVRHLVELGHTRIGLLAGPGRYIPVQRKLAGFRSELKIHGLRYDDRFIVETVFSVEGGAVGAQRLIEQGVTGIVAASDMVALGAIRGARQLGLHVPNDISVIGYDDTELMQLTDPPLSTVRQPVEAIAEHAVRLLVEEIGGAAMPAREYMVRPELIMRGSTGRPGVPSNTRRPA